MASSPLSGMLVAILPCNDLDASERFYNRLGFVGMYELAISDPDETLVRIGWPARNRSI